MTEKGADDHIDALAKKYTGQERYAHRRPARCGHRQGPAREVQAWMSDAARAPPARMIQVDAISRATGANDLPRALVEDPPASDRPVARTGPGRRRSAGSWPASRSGRRTDQPAARHVGATSRRRVPGRGSVLGEALAARRRVAVEREMEEVAAQLAVAGGAGAVDRIHRSEALTARDGDLQHRSKRWRLPARERAKADPERPRLPPGGLRASAHEFSAAGGSRGAGAAAAPQTGRSCSWTSRPPTSISSRSSGSRPSWSTTRARSALVAHDRYF